MTHWPDGDSERARRLVKALNEDLERHWGVPAGVLAQGRTTHLAADSNMAVWTAHGGVVTCTDAGLVANIAGIIERHEGDWSDTVLSGLRQALGAALAERGYLDVHLYCAWPAAMCEQEAVEMLPPEAVWPEGNERVEHVFAVKTSAVSARHLSSVPIVEGSALSRSGCASFAHNRPSLESGGYRFHALGAVTHPDYRHQGLGKAVVSALVDHIASEGGVAPWNCDGLNIPSVRLARAVGFVEFLWHFKWGVSEEEMQYRRGAISRTG